MSNAEYNETVWAEERTRLEQRIAALERRNGEMKRALGALEGDKPCGECGGRIIRIAGALWHEGCPSFGGRVWHEPGAMCADFFTDRALDAANAKEDEK